MSIEKMGATYDGDKIEATRAEVEFVESNRKLIDLVGEIGKIVSESVRQETKKRMGEYADDSLTRLKEFNIGQINIGKDGKLDDDTQKALRHFYLIVEEENRRKEEKERAEKPSNENPVVDHFFGAEKGN